MVKVYCEMKRNNDKSYETKMFWDDGYEIGRISATVNANNGDYSDKLKKFLLASAELFDEIVLNNSRHYRAVFPASFIETNVSDKKIIDGKLRFIKEEL